MFDDGLVEACNASLVYSDHGKPLYACKDVSISIRPNEFLGILGPSGSGKSSLLYLLSGLKTPTSGDVRFLNVSMSKMDDEERSRMRLAEFGFIFQQPFLLGYLSALENVILARGATADQSVTAREEAGNLLAKLGLGGKFHRLPHELSGGERQRVCVARALMGGPKVIFADEPTAALDHTNGSQVVHLLNVNRGEGSLVMVTHDPSMLVEADRILILADGEVTAIEEKVVSPA